MKLKLYEYLNWENLFLTVNPHTHTKHNACQPQMRTLYVNLITPTFITYLIFRYIYDYYATVGIYMFRGSVPNTQFIKMENLRSALAPQTAIPCPQRCVAKRWRRHPQKSHLSLTLLELNMVGSLFGSGHRKPSAYTYEPTSYVSAYSSYIWREHYRECVRARVSLYSHILAQQHTNCHIYYTNRW